MGSKTTIRRVLSVVGVCVQLLFFIFSMFFYVPGWWYMDRGAGGEHAGGLYQYCLKILGSDWTCGEIDKDFAERFMGHKWGAYIAMRAFATMAHLFGFALLILLYVNICVKHKIVAGVTMVLAMVDVLFVLIGSAVASGTFGKVGDADTDTAYAAFMVWISWIWSIAVGGISVGILFATIKDDY